MYICEYCREEAFMACSGCKYAHYCSEECQTADWKTHKKGCKIQQMLNTINDEHAAKPQARPSTTRCTGCNVKFSEDYPCEGECETCGYLACESCVCDYNNGTCYCPTSNFGNNYCEMEPKWYHTDGNGRAYKGDRHPEGYGDEYPDGVYEPEARACNNCSKVTKVFKKEYL